MPRSMVGKDPAPRHRERLSGRDYVLLPLVIAGTVAALGLAAEGGARLLWPEQQHDACGVADGTESRFKPDCASTVKMAESPWVTYAYNDCGYRTAESCKGAGDRVAVLGSSIARGYYVRYQDSWAARAAQAVSARCRRPVSFQNLALPKSTGPSGARWHAIADRVPEALALDPRAAVFVLGPYDLEQYAALPQALGGPPAQPAFAAPRPGVLGLAQRIKGDSRAVYMAEHFLYENEDRYIDLSLRHGDAEDFLRPPLSALWRMRLTIADRVLSRIGEQFKARQVPFVVALVPNRVQAAVAARPPKGVDPYALGAALRPMVESHGGRFVDLTEAFARQPHPIALFYPTDGHPNARGHALIASAIEAALAVPLKGCGGQD